MHKRRRRDPCWRIQQAMMNSKSWFVKVPNLEMIRDCLQYTFETGKPLPDCLTATLLNDIELLLSGRDGLALKKHKRKMDAPSNHPNIAPYLNAAVSYVNTCRKHGYDEHPVKTVCDKYEVSRTTYYRWKKAFPNALNDVPQHELNARLELSSLMYNQHLRRWQVLRILQRIIFQLKDIQIGLVGIGRIKVLSGEVHSD